MITQINTPVTPEMVRNRNAVQATINQANYKPVERSFEQYRKSFLEKKEMKLAKNEYKKLRGTEKYDKKRIEFANQILTSRPPKWGGIKVLLID